MYCTFIGYQCLQYFAVYVFFGANVTARRAFLHLLEVFNEQINDDEMMMIII